MDFYKAKAGEDHTVAENAINICFLVVYLVATIVLLTASI